MELLGEGHGRTIDDAGRRRCRGPKVVIASRGGLLPSIVKPVSESAYVCADSDLGQVLRNQQAKMETLADSLPPERILGRSIDELQAELIAEFRVNPLSLDWDAVTADQGETPIDVSRDPLRAISDRSRPFHLTGTVVTCFVPFEGDTELFKCRPSTFTTVFPTGRVRNGHVELRYQAVNPKPESVKRELDAELAQLRQWVGFVNADVAAFNAELPAWTRAVLECRLAKVRADQDLVASLGVLLRRREDAPTTYVAPAIRRKANIRPVRPIAQRAVPHEPVMAADEYEHILGVIQNMVEVMERSPTAFAAMKEEHLRDHFLVQLNSQYEGGATGETFNFEGKTGTRAAGRWPNRLHRGVQVLGRPTASRPHDRSAARVHELARHEDRHPDLQPEEGALLGSSEDLGNRGGPPKLHPRDSSGRRDGVPVRSASSR